VNIVDIITKKKNNEELSYEELDFAFNGYLDKDVADYQMSALLMAITINGLSLDETINLTDIFIKSGDVYSFKKKVADKHSTGGIGDTTTLVAMPIVAACGVAVAKMSGRGLGFTGGTIDKLEAIPGFEVEMDKDDFYEQIKEIGIAICSQSDKIVPLDKAIYSLRDVTGTTESLALIASSIISKKIACGASYIVIDIKVGNGALIKTQEEAEILSDWMVKIGKHFKRQIETIITPMDEPLADSIGNALEIIEAIEVLDGKKGKLYEVSIEIAAHILAMAKNISMKDAIILAQNAIKRGAAKKMFVRWIKAQRGILSALHVSDKVVYIRSKEEGTVEEISAINCGRLAMKLGAGRVKKNDEIDYSVGVKILKQIGDYVKERDILAELYVADYNFKLDEEDLNLFVIK